MKNKDLWLVSSVMNIIAGAGLAALGIISIVSFAADCKGKCRCRRKTSVPVRRAKK